MDQIIAYCGLACHECGALLATQADDDEKRAEVAREWSEQFNVDVSPENINCDGCLSERGRLFSHCMTCQIRKCAREKDLDNCGYCDEYPCEKLGLVFQNAPNAKKTLDKIRARM